MDGIESPIIMKPRDYLVVAAIALFGGLAIFKEQIFGGNILAGADYFNYWFPLYGNSLAVWRDGGGIAIWLRQLHGGIPVLASMNCMDLYPTQLFGIITGIPANLFFSWDAILHIILAALGCSFMLTCMGIGRWGAMFGGLIYAFSGLTITTLRFGVHPMIRAAALLPWVVGFLLRSFKDDKWAVAWGGGIIALLIFTNAVQMVVFLAVWCGVIVVFEHGPMRFSGRVLRFIGLFGLGGVLGAVWLIPGFEYYPLSSRAFEGVGFMETESLKGFQLMELIFPGLFGSYLGEKEYAGLVLTLYPGLFPLLLCFLGMMFYRRKYLGWLFAGILMFLLSFGPNSVLGTIVQHLPGLGGFRCWRRWLHPGMLSMSLFTSIGMELFMNSQRIRKKLATVAIALTLLIGILNVKKDLVFKSISEAEPFKSWFAQYPDDRIKAESVVSGAMLRGVKIGSIVSLAGVVVSVVPLGTVSLASIAMLNSLPDLLLNGRKYIVSYSAKAEFPADGVGNWLSGRRGDYRIYSLEQTSNINLRMKNGLESFGGYHGLPPERMVQFYNLSDRYIWAAEIRKLYGVRYYLVCDQLQEFGLEYMGEARNITNQMVRIYRDVDASAGISFPKKVVWASGYIPCLKVMSGEGWNREIAVVEQIRGGEAKTVLLGHAKVLMNVKGIRSRRYKLISNGTTLAVFPETWYPGWRILLDGNPIMARSVNWFLVGTFIPQGKHELLLVYDPQSLRVGLWITILALSILVTGWGICKLSKT